MGSDSVLLDLKILNGNMFLKFDKYVNNYTVNVASDVDTLEIEYKIRDTDEIKIVNNEILNYGLNYVFLEVTSEEEKNVYISTESSSGATYSCETTEDLNIALKTYISNYVEVENDNSNKKNFNNFNKAKKEIVDIISEWEKEQRKNHSEKIKAALRAKKLREEQNIEEEMER